MADEQHAPLYLQGVEHFNRGEYFESHEVWEELWLGETGEDRQFCKGLIQAAVALYHLENGNAVGSRKLVESSAAYLQSYRPQHRGLDVDEFLRCVRRCFEENVGVRAEVPGDLVCRPWIELHASGSNS
jgi:hypothetical protein